MDLSNENVIHIKKDGIEYLQFKKLLEYEDEIVHGYAIGLDKDFRLSEIEKPLGIKSYKTLCNGLNLNYDNLVKPNQTHTNNVKVISNENLHKPNFAVYKDTDGLITNEKDLILATTNADCILMFFYDPVKKVIANVHSGWKGTLNRISLNTVKLMHEEYGCNFEDIICCMCPSIRKCHFEVDKDVYTMFKEGFSDLSNIDDIIEKKGEKWHIDTILINRTILSNIGLKDENIIDSGICSLCNKDIIHSYRAEGASYGLSSAVITLI